MKTAYILCGLFLLLLMGCENVDLSKLSDADLERVSEKLIVCNAPYMRHESGCCLDKDNNKICDEDEGTANMQAISTSNVPESNQGNKPNENCVNDCTVDTCKNFDYEECVEKENGCKYKLTRGKLMGKCSVECLEDSGCIDGNKCVNYKCKTKSDTCTNACTSDTCNEFKFIECILDSNGCRKQENRGEILGKCDVQCLTVSECNSTQECNNHKCSEKPAECKEIQTPYQAEETYTTQIQVNGSRAVLKTVNGEYVKDIVVINTESDRITSNDDECTPKIRLFNPNSVNTAFDLSFTTYTQRPYLGSPKPFTYYEQANDKQLTINANDYLEVTGSCYLTSINPAPAETKIVEESIKIYIVPNEFIKYVQEPPQYKNVTQTRLVTKYRTETVCSANS